MIAAGGSPASASPSHAAEAAAAATAASGEGAGVPSSASPASAPAASTPMTAAARKRSAAATALGVLFDLDRDDVRALLLCASHHLSILLICSFVWYHRRRKA